MGGDGAMKKWLAHFRGEQEAGSCEWIHISCLRFVCLNQGSWNLWSCVILNNGKAWKFCFLDLRMLCSIHWTWCVSLLLTSSLAGPLHLLVQVPSGITSLLLFIPLFSLLLFPHLSLYLALRPTCTYFLELKHTDTWLCCEKRYIRIYIQYNTDYSYMQSAF